MRVAHLARVMILAALAGGTAFGPASAQDVKAGAPTDLSVTIYRDPYRDVGDISLDYLGGFALITETRRVSIPAGLHRIRFEGVADGIDAPSAIVTGLPDGVLEKNRDYTELSPSTLIAAAASNGDRVFLNRTNPATGAITSTEAKIRSGERNGILFETAGGVEALRCSGLPETFSFNTSGAGLSALPTLSVLTRSEKPIEAVVQLSYLSVGFDWAASYTADMSSLDGRMNLGGWITLANSNHTSFPNARVQVVAGRLNHDTDTVEPLGQISPVLATCWPLESTGKGTPVHIADRWQSHRGDRDVVIITANKREETIEDVAVAVTAIGEELGDLKLYRVPDRTTLASHQSKQIRLLDRASIPVTKNYRARAFTNYAMDYVPVNRVIKTKNDKSNNLGLPIPSGSVSVFELFGKGAATQRALAGEGGIGDYAVNEDVEILLEGGAEVLARVVKERRYITGSRPAPPTMNGATVRDGYTLSEINRIELSNARPVAIDVEVELHLIDGAELVTADQAPVFRNGLPMFRATVPSNAMVAIRYQSSAPIKHDEPDDPDESDEP